MKTLDRKSALLRTAEIWPEAKLGRTSTEDLLWLCEIASLLPTAASRSMADTMAKYREGYEPTIAYSGRASLCNGDPTAAFLAGMSPADTIAAAERLLGFAAGELADRYSHLNPGSQRMNSGNRIRAALKRGDIQEGDLH